MSAGKQENVVFHFFEINILQNWPIKIFTESLLQIIRSNKTYEGSILCRHLLVQSINEKNQNNVWNMIKDNNNDTKTSLMSFWCLYYWLWTYFKHYFGVSIVDVEQVNTKWENKITLQTLVMNIWFFVRFGIICTI